MIAPLFVGGRVLHVLTEMGSTLETFAIDDTSGALGKRLDSISTLPPPPSRKTTHHDSGSDEATSLPDGGRLLRGRAAAAGAETTRTTKEEEGAVTEEDEATCQKAAEILLSADNRFVYASNRGASNSIAVYVRDTDSGTLSLVEVRARRTNQSGHLAGGVVAVCVSSEDGYVGNGFNHLSHIGCPRMSKVDVHRRSNDRCARGAPPLSSLRAAVQLSARRRSSRSAPPLGPRRAAARPAAHRSAARLAVNRSATRLAARRSARGA